jgi:hypothetical protein
VASACTEPFGRPGTAYVGTHVYLKAVNGSQRSLEILGLSDESAYPAGVTNGDELDESITAGVDVQRTCYCRFSSHKVRRHRYFCARPFRREDQRFALTLTFSRSACRSRICPATGLIRTCESSWKWLYRTTRFDIEIYKGAYEAAIWQSIRFL